MVFDTKLNALTEPELMNSAKEQFGETPDILESSLQQLRSWISKSPHLQDIQQDDKTLKMFLRGCKLSLERTKEKLDMYHSVKGSLPEWFDNWNPFDPFMQEFLKSGVFLPLPGYDKKGRFVVLFRGGKMDATLGTLNDYLKAVHIVQTMAIGSDEQTSIQGFVQISDMAGMGLQHVPIFDIATMKKLVTVTEKAWPLRPKAEHLLNVPGLMESLNNMFQRMKKQKIQDRVHVHKTGDLRKLHEDVGLNILPEEYGGTNGTIEELTKYWKKTVEDNMEALLELNSYKTDESKRPGKPIAHAEIFGIEGSFRKLNID